MSVVRKTVYTLACDGCLYRIESPDGAPEFETPTKAAAAARELGWDCTNGRHYCPNCCPTCSWPTRETVGMVCQTCGTDYGGTA